MFRKLSFSQRVLQHLAAEKQAGVAALAVPAAVGAALVGGVHVLKEGVKGENTKNYKSGFRPGAIESSIH